MGVGRGYRLVRYKSKAETEKARKNEPDTPGDNRICKVNPGHLLSIFVGRIRLIS